jgi:hypothetical protein
MERGCGSGVVVQRWNAADGRAAGGASAWELHGRRVQSGKLRGRLRSLAGGASL